jgi:hypothetical protein
MDCTRWHEALSARLDGEARPEDERGLEAHLDACDACNALSVELAAQHRRFRLHPAPVMPDLVGVALRHAPFTEEAAPPPVVPMGRRQVVVLRAIGVAAVAAIGFTTAVLAGAFRGGVEHANTVVDVATVRPAAAGKSTVVYLSLENRGASDVVTTASSPVAESVSMHRSQGHSGEAVMQPVTTVATPAGSTGLFASDRVHVMLEGLRRDLEPGDTVPVTLTFGHSGTVTVQAVVLA